MTDLPFVFKLRDANTKSLARRNKAERRSGDRAFRLYSQERKAMVAAMRSRAKRTEIDRWSHHPDERVLAELNTKIASLFDERINTPSGISPIEVQEAILHRAIENAGDALWTALLDNIATAYEHNSNRAVPVPQDRLERVGAWISAQTDTRVLGALWAADLPYLRKMIIENATVLDEQLFFQIMHDLEKDLLGYAGEKSLAQNRVLMAKYWPQIQEWIAGMGFAENVFGFLSHALEEGHRPSPEIVAMLEQAVSSPYRVSQVEWAVLAWPDASDDLLAKCVKRFVHSNDSYIAAFVRHPNAGVATFRAAAEATGSQEIRQFLAEHAEAVYDPQVRASLMNSTSVSVLLTLCRTATDSELRELVDTMRKRAPRALIAALGDEEIGARIEITPEMYAELLESTDRHVRLHALFLADRMQTTPPPKFSPIEQPPQKTERRGFGRYPTY